LSKFTRSFYRGEETPKTLGDFCNFQKYTQSKQSPNGRKIGQSGHPVNGLSRFHWRTEAVCVVKKHDNVTSRKDLLHFIYFFLKKVQSGSRYGSTEE
jgi:hypothetical protein